MFPNLFTGDDRRKRLIVCAGVCLLVWLVGLGVFGSNGWLPQMDSLTAF